MITLLHGDHIEDSRRELSAIKLRAAGKEIRNLDGRSVDEAMLRQSLESSSLFGGDVMVVIEQLFSKISKKQKLVEQLCTILVGADVDIVLWEDKEVGPATVKRLGSNCQVRLFKLPVIIFQFLDALIPANSRTTLDIYEKLTSNEPAELVYSMVAKRVSQLIQLTDHEKPDGLADWQVSRLTRQANSFTMEQLLSMYKSLADIDYTIKTGLSPFTMKQSLEQWIAEL